MFLPIYFFFFPPQREINAYSSTRLSSYKHRIARGDHAPINVLFPMQKADGDRFRNSVSSEPLEWNSVCTMLVSLPRQRNDSIRVYTRGSGMVWLPAKTTNNREGERCFDSLWRYALTPLCRASTTRVSIYLQRLGRHWTGRGDDCLRFESQTKHWASSALLEGTNE